MKVSDAITYCIHYHKINSRPNPLAHYKFLLGKFGRRYPDRDIGSILTEDIIVFLIYANIEGLLESCNKCNN